MKPEVANHPRRLTTLLVSCAAAAVLAYAAGLSLDTGHRTPEFISEQGLLLSFHDLRRTTMVDDIPLDPPFFYLIPEFRSLEDQRSFLATNRLIWNKLQQSDHHEFLIGDQKLSVKQRPTTPQAVLAKFGPMYVVATLFGLGALIALWRYSNQSGRVAALFLFGASLFSLSLPALITRGLTLPYDSIRPTLSLYYIGSCVFVALVYFPYTFNSSDLKPWVAKLVFWFLALTTGYFIVQHFVWDRAIAADVWFTITCALLFVGRVIQRGWRQYRERNVTHLALCYLALLLTVLSFSALVTWPELLAIELSGLQYFVLTSTVVPVAMISLLESELLQQRTERQEQQLASQQAESESRAQQARQTVIMNLHDHVARSLDSISALALRAKLTGAGQSRLDRIRDHAMHAHRALRGLFSVSDESCDSWPALRVRLREYGNSLLEHRPIDFQLNEWHCDDSEAELDASVKLVCFHVMSEAITNAEKHSNAACISVDMGAKAQDFYLRITDNGGGFNPKTVDESRHHGLNIMRKRAKLIQGELQINSEPGTATSIELRGPLSPPDYPSTANHHTAEG